jgi:hypothetical protein
VACGVCGALDFDDGADWDYLSVDGGKIGLCGWVFFDGAFCAGDFGEGGLDVHDGEG